MPFVSTRDGIEIFYKDWGHGPPVVFHHGWPLGERSTRCFGIAKAFGVNAMRSSWAPSTCRHRH